MKLQNALFYCFVLCINSFILFPVMFYPILFFPFHLLVFYCSFSSFLKQHFTFDLKPVAFSAVTIMAQFILFMIMADCFYSKDLDMALLASFFIFVIVILHVIELFILFSLCKQKNKKKQ